MDDAPSPPENKLKLGQRSFEKVNQPTSDTDPNAIHQILNENKAVDASFDLPGIDQEISLLWRRRRKRDLQVLAFITVVDASCLAGCAWANWSPYVTVPLISVGALITAATLGVVYLLLP